VHKPKSININDCCDIGKQEGFSLQDFTRGFA